MQQATALVGVNEAARLLGLHASTVSRNVKAGVIPNRGTAERPLIDVAEARAAREEGLDRSKQRGARAPLFAAAAEAGDNPTYQNARARRETAAATIAEIELAKRRGETLDRAEVVDAAFQLGQLFREALDARRAGIAQRLAGLEAGALEAVLADADRAALGRLADLIEERFAKSEERRIAA